MARPPLLSEEDIREEMKNLPNWERHDKVIIREAAGENFPDIIGKVNAVAVLAETMNHHPDILIYGWNKVRIKLSTHDQGGLTELDFKLAGKIEDLKI